MLQNIWKYLLTLRKPKNFEKHVKKKILRLKECKKSGRKMSKIRHKHVKDAWKISPKFVKNSSNIRQTFVKTLFKHSSKTRLKYVKNTSKIR